MNYCNDTSNPQRESRIEMNIVFFIQNMGRAGGSERVCSLIANYLYQKGNSVTVLSICGTNASFFFLEEGIKQDTLIHLDHVDNKKQFFSVVTKLYSFYRRNKVDLVIDVFPALSIYTLLLKKKFQYKNITWEHFNYLNNSGMNRLGRKIAVAYSNMIVTLTETDKQLYIDNNPSVKGKIEYIFNPTPFPNEEANNNKDNSVLAIGRLEKEKGFHNLILVWSQVEQKVKNSVLYIIGDGEQKYELEEMIKRHNLKNIVLTGKISNVADYYKKAVALVSTSEHEGLPMTMIEAQSFGVPIISFDYLTGPEDIITPGEDGYIIRGITQEEKNTNMARQLITFLSDTETQNKMGEKSKNNSSRFSIDEIGKKWDRVIEKI